MPKKISNLLGSLREDELRTRILMPLFEAMRFHDVSLNHGSTELGKDIVMWKRDEFGARVNYAVVAKAGAITGAAGGAKSSSGVTVAQIRQCFGSTYCDPVTGQAQNVDCVIVAASGRIGEPARKAMLAQLDPHSGRHVRFIEGTKLWDDVRKHLPGFSVAPSSEALQNAIRSTALANGLAVEVTDKTVSVTINAASGVQPSELSGSFSVVANDSEAGQAAQEALRIHEETGAPITLTKEMLGGVELPAILAKLGFVDHAATWEEVHLGPRKGPVRDFFLDFEALDGAHTRLGPIPCAVAQVGSREGILRSERRAHGWTIALTFDLAAKSCRFDFDADLAACSIPVWLNGLRAFHALAVGGAITLREAESLRHVTKTTISPDSSLEPEPSLVQVLEALVVIEECAGRSLPRPTGSLPSGSIYEILNLARLLVTGHNTRPWSGGTAPLSADDASRIVRAANQQEPMSIAYRAHLRPTVLGIQLDFGIIQVSVPDVTVAAVERDRVLAAIANGTDSLVVALQPAREGAMVTLRRQTQPTS